MKDSVFGEEDNQFKSGDQTITIAIHDTEEETASCLLPALQDKDIAAKLAACAHQ